MIVPMPKVLVVDDEPAMVKVLSGFLAQEKIPCSTASSGDETLRSSVRSSICAPRG